jgi:hypothetical protein
MKPFLLIALFLLITSSSFAQLFGRNYTTGAYYTVDGQKYNGLIAMDFDPPSIFSSRDNTIFFKTDTGAQRVKIKVSTIKAFCVTNRDTARTDSFVIIHNLNLSRIKYDYDIIQVIYDKGPVKLYNYRLQRRVGGGFNALLVTATYYDNYYFYGADANTAVELKNKNFIEVMSNMLADAPDIVEMIKNKTYKMGDMHEMLKRYNARGIKAATNNPDTVQK